MNAAPNRGKNLRVAALAAGIAVGMAGLAYASVPLYRIFCQATGFGGTTQRAAAAPEYPIEKTITVRFDANTAASLGWLFKPEQIEMKVKLGEQALAHYRAINHAKDIRVGTATFNVTPPAAGVYFNKIQCFCFTEQTLKPGESVDMPVAFFVDPAILDDPDARAIDTITLSYTFYPVETPGAASN
ncbi:MAG: cytochrome c oxidase assembly protein [Rhizobiales bacterium]|nr:cytochrome c oxidase assembly protein [Hyphomicrobiales bacterium]